MRPRLCSALLAGAITASPVLAQAASPETREPTPEASPDPEEIGQRKPRPPGVPEVKSREDYEALLPAERERFNRWRRPPVTVFVDPRVEFTGSADFNGRDGDVSITRAGAQFGPAFRVTDNADFALRFETEWSFYDFEDSAGVIGGPLQDDEPLEDAQLLAVSPVINVENPGGWSWFAGGRFQSSGETDADFSDTLTGGGFGGAMYPITENLRIGGGIAVTSELSGDGVFITPLPLFEWRITDRLSLGTSERGVRLAYQPSFGWEFAIEGTIERREYRLDDDGDLPDGAVIDRVAPVVFAVSYKPHPRFNVTGRVGSVVWGEFEFFDEDGSKVSDVERDPAIFGGLELKLRF